MRDPDSAGRLLRVEAARDQVVAQVAGPLEAEVVAVVAALGRVLAAPVVAATSLPPWDNSAMDGYALRSDDIAEAREDAPVRLAVTDDVGAGGVANLAVTAGSAIRIATGAPLPAGADAVLPVEATTPLDAQGVSGPRGRDASGPRAAAILAHEAVAVGANVRRAGSDLRAGDVVLESGRSLSPAAVALAAGCGVANVRVHRRPRVAVLATGNEVRPAGEPLGPAGIPDANGPGLRALVAATGADVIDLGIARDDLDEVRGRLRDGLSRGADAIIVSGGVSVGPYDVVKLAFESVGRIDLWRVAVQPGKPFAFGTAERPAGGPAVLLFGLPGNPASGFVTFELFVRPAIRRLAGHARLLRPVERAVLLEEATTSPGRRAFLRVAAEREEAGAPRRDARGRALVRLARGPGGQSSHVISALAAADAFAVVPEDVVVQPAGGEVELWWLDPA